MPTTNAEYSANTPYRNDSSGARNSSASIRSSISVPSEVKFAVLMLSIRLRGTIAPVKNAVPIPNASPKNSHKTRMRDSSARPPIQCVSGRITSAVDIAAINIRNNARLPVNRCGS